VLSNGSCSTSEFGYGDAVSSIARSERTTHPFEIIGAPYVDYHFYDALTRRAAGVTFREPISRRRSANT